MLRPEQVEELIFLVSTMQRDDLVERLLHFRGNFPIDFSESFLRGLSLDRLRHIFVALCLHHSELPDGLPTAA